MKVSRKNPQVTTHVELKLTFGTGVECDNNSYRNLYLLSLFFFFFFFFGIIFHRLFTWTALDAVIRPDRNRRNLTKTRKPPRADTAGMG